MDRIHGWNDELGREIKKSNKYIAYFGWALLKDKLLLCMIVLCVLAIIGIIITAAVKRKSPTALEGQGVNSAFEFANSG